MLKTKIKNYTENPLGLKNRNVSTKPPTAVFLIITKLWGRRECDCMYNQLRWASWGKVMGEVKIRRISTSLFPGFLSTCRFAQIIYIHFIKISQQEEAPWAINWNTDLRESGFRVPIFYG